MAIADFLDAPVTWWPDARCKGVDPELFFPSIGKTSNPAKAICNECPREAECLEYALSAGEKFGVWGGTSERERVLLTKARRIEVRDDGEGRA